MEHSLHLVAKHFIESIAPCLGKKHSSTEDVDDEDDNDNDDDDIDTVDALSKAIALVKQASSPLIPWVCHKY
jgi:hypothetical protein